MVAEVFHFYAGAVDKHYDETIPVAGGIDLTFREPLREADRALTCPLNIALWKLSPAPCLQIRERGLRNADLERAAAAAPYALFVNAGQDCCARSRILVQRSVYHRFLGYLVDATRGRDATAAEHLLAMIRRRSSVAASTGRWGGGRSRARS